jgi:hypothetical protein
MNPMMNNATSDVVAATATTMGSCMFLVVFDFLECESPSCFILINLVEGLIAGNVEREQVLE